MTNDLLHRFKLKMTNKKSPLFKRQNTVSLLAKNNYYQQWNEALKVEQKTYLFLTTKNKKNIKETNLNQKGTDPFK